jgi:DNA anti-recombination protein RmuC
VTDDEFKSLFEGVRQDITTLGQDLRQELRQEMAGIRQELREETAAIRQELRQETTSIRQELSSSAAANVETRRHLEILIEAARHETRLVAEGQQNAQEMFARECADIREEVRRTSNESQAMFKYFHADLDRRVRAIEES